jgi:FkbM family methyltransferase
MVKYRGGANMSSIDMNRFIALAKKHCDVVDTIFEIGSLNGEDSLLFKRNFPTADVYAFEGLPENYNLYIENFSKINSFNKVIFNYDGDIIFHKKNINGIHGVFDRGSLYGTDIVNLNCYRLDSVCDDLSIDHIDMIKIDVEGATYEVLEGMGKLLSTVKIMHIETEDYPFFKGQKLDDEVKEFLLEHKFSIIDKSSCLISDNNFQFDSVWVKV